MEQLFIKLLVRLGVVTSLASFFVRSKHFRALLMQEDRTLGQRLQMALWFFAMFGSGVALRLRVRAYDPVDLGFEGSLLAGMLGGYVTGLLAGLLIALPAMVAPHGEYVTLPFYASIGLLGGVLRDAVADKENIWRTSPLLDIPLIQSLREGRHFSRPLFQLLLISVVAGAEFLRETLGIAFKGMLHTLYPPSDEINWLVILALFASTYFAITLPIKVWNNTRNELKLEEQNRLLLQARLQALTSQINPHFLFNTLNSVSTLIRIDPQRAREMVIKLSNILRRLLRKHESLTHLRDELDFIGDYLAIEQARFGEKLRFVSDVDPRTMDMLVPSMMLQPLIENCVKHGLSSKVEGGTIRLEARLVEGRLQLSIEDDGVGIQEQKLARMLGSGIGMSNVNERLRVLYGSNYRMWVDSAPGRGTRIEIEVPDEATIQSRHAQ